MRVFTGLCVVLSMAFSPQARADALSASCRAGDPFSCLEGPPTMPTATKACELGQPRGCLAAATLLLNGQTVKPAQALTFYEKACALGDAVGCFGAGKLYSDVSSKRPDFARAFLVLYRSCRQGHGPACTLVGALHSDGAGTPRDDTRAAMAFHNGCERRDPRACVLLGQLLVQPADAAAAYQQACKLGNPEGCGKLDALVKAGAKPPPKLSPLLDPLVEKERILRTLPGGRDPKPFVETAVCAKTLEPACVSGDLAVCQQHADLLQNGGDGSAAYCMKRQACERGDGYACEQLGDAHERGLLPSEPKTMFAWYEKGCIAGSAAACASAARVIATLDPKATPNQRATRRLELRVRACALDSGGDCSLVYKNLLSRIADPALAHRAWVSLGRWCEKERRDGPACAVVEDRRKAIVLERDCQSGKAVACREAAGLSPDPLRESALLGKACAMGDCHSCVGRKTVEGVKLADARSSQLKAVQVCPAECAAVPVDGAEPKACEHGVRALIAVGNERKAIALAEQQCRRGFACGLLAELYVVSENLSVADERRLGSVLDKACADRKSGTCQARTELEQVKPSRDLCRQGKLEGCLKLGELLTQSNVELPQISLAWDRACKLGSNLGCVRHWAGLRTSADAKAAEASHEKAARACDEGELQICIELANHLKFRANDPAAIAELKVVGEKVVERLSVECEAGSAEACESAANFLHFKKELDGEGRARAFLSKACELGAAPRCLELAEQAVRVKDYGTAALYGGKGCMSGSSVGCRLLVKSRVELTPVQLAEADRALGLACGRKVTDACQLAADAGVPVRIESPASPMPVSSKN